MKNRVLKLLFSMVLAMLMFACQKEDVTLNPESDNPDVKPQSFKELGLVHTYSVPEEALDYEVSDLQGLFLSKSNLKNASLNDIEYPSMEELSNIVNVTINKYPDVYTMNQADLEMVKTNFPGLTEEEIYENLDLIDDYYTKNIQYDLIIGVAGLKPSVKSDDGNYLGTGLYKREFWYLSTKPRAAIAISDAAEDAVAYTVDYYGVSSAQDQSDAFRHIMWNALIAKYYAKKKKSVSKGVTLAEEFTNIHEECNHDVDNVPAYDCQMDYHNNWIGRDYFEDIASIKKKGLRRYLDCPDNDDMASTVKGKVDNGEKVDTTVAAVNAVSKYTPVYFK